MSRDLEVSLHGEGVSIEDGRRVGESMLSLLDAVSAEAGVPVGWRVARVEFKCDGCDLRLPDRPAPDAGWSHAAGDDFCPVCTTARSAA